MEKFKIFRLLLAITLVVYFTNLFGFNINTTLCLSAKFDEEKVVELHTQEQLDTIILKQPTKLIIQCSNKWRNIVFPHNKSIDSLIFICFSGYNTSYNNIFIKEFSLSNVDVYFIGRKIVPFFEKDHITRIYDPNDTAKYALVIPSEFKRCNNLEVSGYDSMFIPSPLFCVMSNINVVDFHSYLDSTVFSNLYYTKDYGGLSIRCYYDSVNSIKSSNWCKYVKKINGKSIYKTYNYLYDLDVDSLMAVGKLLNERQAFSFVLYTKNMQSFDELFYTLYPEILADTSLYYFHFKTDFDRVVFYKERVLETGNEKNDTVLASLFISHNPDSIFTLFTNDDTRVLNTLWLSVNPISLKLIRAFAQTSNKGKIYVYRPNCFKSYRRKASKISQNSRNGVSFYCAEELFNLFVNLER